MPLPLVRGDIEVKGEVEAVHCSSAFIVELPPPNLKKSKKPAFAVETPVSRSIAVMMIVLIFILFFSFWKSFDNSF